MSKFVSALVGVSMLGLAGAANAAQPLTETEMDTVTAGATVVRGPFLNVRSAGAFNPIGGITLQFNTDTFWVVNN